MNTSNISKHNKAIVAAFLITCLVFFFHVCKAGFKIDVHVAGCKINLKAYLVLC
ncbi:hypothetical protein BDD43_2218 [Mucilaginibacter gracilis]|uniref:Uncharacterized protein n=1 Tax=Mucilaginibacter gracilis TaxID=423350 RepID=A0A495J095_9SPHI|nr:hypothetical protein BDD43_2218 [Mucilaginibacter gracilis]